MKTTDKIEKADKWYGVIFSVITVTVGCLFIWQVLDLYFSRRTLDEIYTRAIVVERLNAILVPIIIWLVTAVIGIVLNFILPKKQKPVKLDDAYVLNRLKNRMPETPKGGLENEYGFIKNEEKKIKYVKLACFFYVVAVALYGLIYFLIPSNFTELENATKEVVKTLKYVYPFVAIAFIVCIAASFYESASAKKQLPVVRKIIVGEKQTVKAIKNDEKVVLCARIALLVIGVALVVLGIFNGGMHDVFVKAVNICTECIGLG